MTVTYTPWTLESSTASPCVGVCRMSADGSVCEGCSRTLDEIARWGNASAHERRAILAQVEARKQALFSS